jgi:Tfp pilus assembly protein PilX
MQKGVETQQVSTAARGLERMKNKLEMCRRDDGVALVIVLGLLSILTILAVAFASAMLVERLAAWNHANAVRAEGLVQAGLVRAMTDVNLSTAGLCYPCWTNRPAKRADAMGTDINNGKPCTTLMSGEATNTIPVPLQADAKAVASTCCYWSNIVVNGKTNGRVAYVVVNASGLIDVNYAAGRTRTWSTNLNEIDPRNLLKNMTDPTFAQFIAGRNTHVRYETMPEAIALNSAIGPNNAGFNTFSLDTNRDQYFEMATASDLSRIMTLGSSYAETNLTTKFNINAIARTNADGSYRYVGYTNSWDYNAYKNDNNFMTEYFNPLVAILSRLKSDGSSKMMERPLDVAWNIVGYLDPDLIPQGDDTTKPWARSEGGEPIPLVNEIVLQPYSGAAKATGPLAGGSNYYEFAVELWYPFVPMVVVPTNKFSVWVGVFTNDVNAGGGNVNELSITNLAYVATNFTFVNDINNMAYGGNTEFLCVTSPLDKKICFPVRVYLTNKPAITYVTNYLPIGVTNYVDGSNNTFTVTNQVWFLSRVYKQEYNPSVGWTNLPVDEAMGYAAGATDGKDDDHKLKLFTNAVGYSVADPRSNGQQQYWHTDKAIGGLGPYPFNDANQTLGTTNKNCDPWSRSGSGLPIFIRNGLMENIGELGYIWRSNLNGGPPWEPRGTNYFWWRTIDLMHFDEGAALLDLCTVRPTNTPTSAYGVFAINSKQTNAVKAMLNNMRVGYVNGAVTNTSPLKLSDVDYLAATIISNGPYMSFRSMFTTNKADDGGGGPVADAFRRAGTNAVPCVGDIYGEDVFRRVCELITFRQNIFIVTVAAQVFGGDGQTVVGEKRGSAMIYRDSYTGKYFIRSFKWLSD